MCLKTFGKQKHEISAKYLIQIMPGKDTWELEAQDTIFLSDGFH